MSRNITYANIYTEGLRDAEVGARFDRALWPVQRPAYCPHPRRSDRGRRGRHGRHPIAATTHEGLGVTWQKAHRFESANGVPGCCRVCGTSRGLVAVTAVATTSRTHMRRASRPSASRIDRRVVAAPGAVRPAQEAMVT